MLSGSLDERWVFAVDACELPENGMVAVTIGEHEIAIYRLAQDEFRATSNVCTHGFAYLTDGWLAEDGTVECPLHAGCFDVRTGRGKGDPIDEDIRTYRVRNEGGRVLVEIPAG